MQATGVVRATATAVPWRGLSCTLLAWRTPLPNTWLTVWTHLDNGNRVLEMENYGLWVFRVVVRNNRCAKVLSFTYLTHDDDLIEDTYQQMQRVDFQEIADRIAEYGQWAYMQRQVGPASGAASASPAARRF